jgi:hypothetical protein
MTKMKKILVATATSFLVLNLMAQETTSDTISSTTPPAQSEPQGSQPSVSQTVKEARRQASKIYYGGYLNLSFGKYTVIGAEPMIGYKITPKFSAGLKLRYDYIKDKRYSTTYTTSNYGGSIFTRYRIIPALYLHAEYAYYNYELFYSNETSERKWVPFLFLGAGYSQRLGGNAWFNLQILFDVLQNSNSPYNNWEPFYSVGVGVGF